MEMKKILIGGVVVIGLVALNFKSLILGAMDVVDYVGEKTDTNVVSIIDNLNEFYYSIYED